MPGARERPFEKINFFFLEENANSESFLQVFGGSNLKLTSNNRVLNGETVVCVLNAFSFRKQKI